MFRGVARNVFSSLANGEEKEDAPDENDEIVVTHSSPPIRVRYNDPCCCTGWPGMCVVAVQINNNMLPLIGLRLTCSARDQNWGNTGHSMMSLVMINRSGQLKNEVVQNIMANNINCFLREKLELLFMKKLIFNYHSKKMTSFLNVWRLETV